MRFFLPSRAHPTRGSKFNLIFNRSAVVMRIYVVDRPFTVMNKRNLNESEGNAMKR
ncbi:hypothetical protein SSCG_00273 [Streptomyces clavuligerus]|nr:hypothetical protein SSCG_00273 [Streptomyces clavuligerus]